MTILSVKNVSKKYGNFYAIKDVSFEVNENEIVGFIGPNGAGKSTTMKCINSLIVPTEGTIEVCGFDIKKEREKALEFQASMIESPALHFELSGLDNLKIFASLRNIPDSRIKEIEEFIGIGKGIKKPVKNFSLGMKQRLALGIVLLSDPKFIILDEPTNGLDPTGVLELRKTLISLCKDHGVSILFSSHQLGEIERIADRIICIKEGQLVPIHDSIRDQVFYSIVIDEPVIKEEDLKRIEGVQKLEIKDSHIKITLLKEDSVNDVVDVIRSKTKIKSIQREQMSIEDIYLETFGG